jgi:hypothetical protein
MQQSCIETTENTRGLTLFVPRDDILPSRKNYTVNYNYVYNTGIKIPL